MGSTHSCEIRRRYTTQRVARLVDNMAAALETAAADKRKAASLGLQLEIWKRTPMFDIEKRRMLDRFRRDAAVFFD